MLNWRKGSSKRVIHPRLTARGTMSSLLGARPTERRLTLAALAAMVCKSLQEMYTASHASCECVIMLAALVDAPRHLLDHVVAIRRVDMRCGRKR